MEFLFGDRKRKVEESDTEENQDVKKPHLEEPAEPKQEEIENGNQTKPTVDNDTQEGQDENYISLSVGDSLDGDNDAKEDDAEKEIASFMNLPPIETVVPFDRLVIVNVATNSDDFPGNHAHQVTKENAEIIELSFVIVNAKDMTILDTKQTYVKPERTPVTSQCTQATGIYPETLEYAKGLCDAVKVLQDYIENEIADKFTYCFVSHGAWTLRIQLPREAQDKGIELPGYLAYCKMFDIKQEIQRWQVHHPEISLRSMNLKDLCEAFRVQRATKPSAGLATCLTVVNLMRHLAGFQHPDVFAHPIDTNADLQQFKKEESKVIHLAGLPFEVTQGEVDAWFSSNGLRPTATWMIQTSDHSKPNVAGFVVFQTHADAMRALSLNGRCLSDRAIEVSPSSQRVIDAAGSMLVPFPLQPKGRSLRPGDWNCPSCNFYNYASRRTCYKCNAENPSPSPAALNQPPTHSSNTHHLQPQRFTPGDWICPNYSCGFHNYASRLQCHRCSTQRPPTSSGPHSYGHPAAPPMPAVSGGGGYGRPPNQPAFRPGDWYCPNPACNFQNFASRSICFKCQTPRPGPPPPPRQTYGGASMMPPQTAQPYSYSAAPSTYAAPASYGHSAYQQPSNGGYGYGQQQATTAQNAINYRVNDRYWSTASTTSYQTAPSSPAHENLPGDWTCPNGLCNFHNFAKRTQCAKCGTPAPAVRHTGTASGY